MKTNACLTAIALLLACDAPADRPAAEPGDTAVLPAAPDTMPTELRTLFDPTQIRVDESVADLTVAAAEFQPTQGPLGVSGFVRFSGEAEVAGTYRPHFDYPEVRAPCFWVDSTSWRKLPRAQGDTRVVWFCFANQEEAIAQLGEPGTEARATIVVDDYTTNFQESDAWDTARLVRVTRKESN